MRQAVFCFIPLLLLLASCQTEAARHIPLPEEPDLVEEFFPYTLLDFQGKAEGEAVPSWVDLWLSGGARLLEATDTHEGSYVFVIHNEGTNFAALQQWSASFSPDLDFPRFAVQRVRQRLLLGVTHPDVAYGAFFHALLRSVSDTNWFGAVKEDSFWLVRDPLPEGLAIPETNWEFIILLTIPKADFEFQLRTLFQSVTPNPRLTRDQLNAVNRVKETFFVRF